MLFLIFFTCGIWFKRERREKYNTKVKFSRLKRSLKGKRTEENVFAVLICDIFLLRSLKLESLRMCRWKIHNWIESHCSSHGKCFETKKRGRLCGRNWHRCPRNTFIRRQNTLLCLRFLTRAIFHERKFYFYFSGFVGIIEFMLTVFIEN